MKQQLLDNFNKIICRFGKYRKINLKKYKIETIKVNIGCGLRVADDWINVDATPHALFGGYPKLILGIMYSISGADYTYTKEEYCEIMKRNRFVHHRIEYGLPFEDNSIDYIYSSHMLEHLYKEDSRNFLKEVHRVLKPGGIARICVPDLEYAFSRYKEGDYENTLRLFFVPTKFNYLYQHRYLYDFKHLKEFLNNAGFENVIRCEYQNGSVPDIEKLDVYPEETLYVEAVKI